jgi:hypothetical protein
MNRIKYLAFLIFLSIAGPAPAADVILKWDSVAEAASYKIYSSVDLGAIWIEEIEVTDSETATIKGVPDSGIVLFRVSAKNAKGEAVRTYSGAWYNGDWKPPKSPAAVGIE